MNKVQTKNHELLESLTMKRWMLPWIAEIIFKTRGDAISSEEVCVQILSYLRLSYKLLWCWNKLKTRCTIYLTLKLEYFIVAVGYLSWTIFLGSNPESNTPVCSFEFFQFIVISITWIILFPNLIFSSHGVQCIP